ncbi:MAG TPA: hypothetical protein VK754_09775 [Propionibacteriaceae bacterium]|nr:hypothetical protein [Propionibacteriaceae bacterium]
MPSRNAPSNSDDVIDSRDIIERIEELEGQDESLDSSEALELTALKALAEQISGAEDGEALIRDSYFEDYARELAEDIGALKNAMSWPLTCIDWEQAARELQSDYSAVEFDGVTYWLRS